MPTILVMELQGEWLTVMVSGSMDMARYKSASLVEAKAVAFDFASRLFGPVLVRIME